MCGFAGFFEVGGRARIDQRQILLEMGESLNHRGPDDSGLFIDNRCGFSFKRLAVIDVEGGHQPMISSSGDHVIVSNGEIYNFRELRREMEALGAVFRTKSDTEVLLQGYKYWGEEILEKIRGIFALAIYDQRKRKLFLARDHTGIKPLYYTTSEGIFIFASEIKAILKFPCVSAGVRTDLLPRYMSFLWVPAPDTLFEDIHILEPGHKITVYDGEVSKKPYWKPILIDHDFSLKEDEWVEIIENELRRIVKEQMISDVPVGAFLSGGVDSSTIVHYMNQVVGNTITTFTIGFENRDMADDVIVSDLEYARLAARHLDVEYHEIICKPDVVELLPMVVRHMDEPVADPAAITTYLVCQAAREKCVVVLSGVGGDEIFGGYPRYLATELAEKYQHVPRLLRIGFVEPLIRSFSAGSNSFIRNAKKFIKSVELPYKERYFGYLTYYSEGELKRLLKFDFSWPEIFTIHEEIFARYQSKDKLQSMMNLDLMTFLPNLNLIYTDKMSSAASVEVRVPFLDHLFIERVSKIPGSLKIKNYRRKYILKKLADNKLPHRIVWRKKAGFGAPIGAWLRGQAKEMMMDLLSEDTIKRRGYFEYSSISKMVDDHLTGREYNANQLWQLMNLELWQREFID